jgi:hypothetical protein
MTKTSYAMKSGYYFLFHTLSRLSGSSKIKNKVILIKYSWPIGMFPATQFWVATHRLRTTEVEKHDVQKHKHISIKNPSCHAVVYTNITRTNYFSSLSVGFYFNSLFVTFVYITKWLLHRAIISDSMFTYLVLKYIINSLWPMSQNKHCQRQSNV